MSKEREVGSATYKRIDVPYDKISKCFYCGEASSSKDHVPPVSRYFDYMGMYNTHRPLIVPSCMECNLMLGDSLQPSIFRRFEDQKVNLTRKLGKYIRYGEIWEYDRDTLDDFSGDLGKFAKSIDNMKDIAKSRIEWQHWGVSLDGGMSVIENTYLTSSICVNGKKYASIDHLFEYARRVDKIPQKYLEAVLGAVGKDEINYAYNLCKTVRVTSEKDIRAVIEDLNQLHLEMSGEGD